MIYINLRELIYHEMYPFIGNIAFKSNKIKIYKTFILLPT